MASTKDKILELVDKYLKTLNEEGPAGLRKVMSPDFNIKIAPKSLGIPTPSNLQAYIEVLEQTHQASGTKNMKMFLVEGFEPVIDEEGRRIVLHLQSTADSSFGLVENEFILIFKLTEDCKQIVEQHEFMDSKAFSDLMKNLQAPGK